MPGHQFLQPCNMWKTSFVPESFTGMIIPCCTRKSAGSCVHSSCGWISMLYRPRCSAVLHVPFFSPLLGNQSLAHLRQRRYPFEFLTPPKTTPQRSFTSSHLAFLQFCERGTVSAITMCKIKLWIFCNLQWVPKTFKWYPLPGQINNHRKLTSNSNTPYTSVCNLS